MTISDSFVPAPLYSVLKPVLWSETHHGPPEPRDIPQGSNRFLIGPILTSDIPLLCISSLIILI